MCDMKPVLFCFSYFRSFDEVAACWVRACSTQSNNVMALHGAGGRGEMKADCVEEGR